MRVQIGYKTERGGGEHAALSSVAKRCLTPRLGQRVADGGASRTCTQMRLTVHRNVQSRERSLQTLEDRSRRLSTEECRHPRATCAHSTPHTRTHARTHARAPLAAVSSALKVRILQAKLHRQTRKEQRPESTNAPPLKVVIVKVLQRFIILRIDRVVVGVGGAGEQRGPLRSVVVLVAFRLLGPLHDVALADEHGPSVRQRVRERSTF
mmetsp:Transcript_35944/g.60062  ORF Transcript_35944/g.60062 Transcript_35944/m.60062 type:complete len:209 (+) Transcript_35944:62-688(+)